MSRRAVVIALAAVVLLAAAAQGEIVRVTAEQTRLYDAETKATKPVRVRGKRFMVYGVAKDWYLIEATVSGEKKLLWIPKADVEVDWGQVKQARVVSVPDTNTLELEGDTWVQFTGVEVTRVDSTVTRQTLAWLKGLLEGKEVTLEIDPKYKTDKHGYTLAYVYVDGMFVNRTLVEYGLAATLTTYKTGGGRYASVFGYYEKAAKEKGLGAWAALKPAATSTATTGSGTETGQEQPDQVPSPEQIRTLTPAERMQWARNLVTEVKVATSRQKTKSTEVGAGGDPTSPARVQELVWTKTLTITMKNGWGGQLDGLSVKYEVFSRTGTTSDTVMLLKTGTIEPFSLKPGETRVFTSDPVKFEGRESSETGWQGHKYHGYRVTYLLNGTEVKVDAMPASLVSSRAGQDAE